jgi:hypothetical protein
LLGFLNGRLANGLICGGRALGHVVLALDFSITVKDETVSDIVGEGRRPENVLIALSKASPLPTSKPPLDGDLHE